MIGRQIANYRIDTKLGEGGMGVVYKAMDLDLERAVAIKVLSAELTGDAALLERFRGEAKAQAHLNHANIASLYSLLTIDGHTSIVMEYLEGETLDQILQRRGLIPWQEAVPWFQQALLGIGFAHHNGIVHRDIKPSNIMVNRYGVVKVMDFGIAKMLGGRRLTKTGTQVGTVAYMSPEQVRDQPVDVRSDIYSLGVTLYELLTAHLPFESDSDFQVMSDHVNTPPPPPSRHYPYIPEGIQQCVLKALEKDPDRRYQSVEEFAAALGRSEQPVAGGLSQTVAALSPGQTRIEPGSGATQAPRSADQPAAGQGFSAASAAAARPLGQPLAVPAASNKGKIMLFGGVLVLLAAAGLLGYQMFKPKPAALSLGTSGSGRVAGLSAQPQASESNTTAAQTNSPQPGASLTSASDPQQGSAPDLMKSLQGIAGSEGKTASSGIRRQAAATPNSVVKGRAAAHSGSLVVTPAPPAPQSPSTPVTAAPAATPPPTGPTEAQLDSAEDDLTKMKGRMDAVNQSLTNLKQQQAAQGYGLRGDMVAAESRLYSYFENAQQALQNRNLEAAQKNTERAEKELTTLEHFLGR